MFEFKEVDYPIVYFDGKERFRLPIGISHHSELNIIRNYLEYDCPDPFPRTMLILYNDHFYYYHILYGFDGVIIKSWPLSCDPVYKNDLTLPILPIK